MPKLAGVNDFAPRDGYLAVSFHIVWYHDLYLTGFQYLKPDERKTNTE